MPEGKYYGQWGKMHIYQAPVRGINWLGQLLASSESPVEGEIVSIAYKYHDCQKRVLGNEIARRFTSNYPLTTILDLATEEEIALFKVPDINFERPYLPHPPADLQLAQLRDYYQYIVLI